MLNDSDIKSKRLRFLASEIDRLEAVIAGAPVLKLPKPVHRGWLRKLTLREDITHRPDADVFKKALTLINVTQYSKVDATWKIPIESKVIESRFNPEIENDRKLRKLFFLGHHHVRSAWDGNQKHIVYGYKFAHEQFLTPYIEKNFITHVRVKLPEIESQCDDFMKEFESLGGWNKLNHLQGHRVRYRDLRNSNSVNFSIEEELNAYEAENE